MQEAGKQMGFDMKLDCYEQATTNLMDWFESQNTLFRERPIFKDPQDVASIDIIARSFGIALAKGHQQECEA